MRPPDPTARATWQDLAPDLAGIGLIGAGVWWGTRVAGSVGGDPTPLVRFAVAAVAAYASARTVARVAVWLPPAVIVTGTALLTLSPVAQLGTYRSGLPFGPLAYANASAALYLLAVVAGMVIARQHPRGAGRWLGVLAAVLASTAVLASGSTATVALLALLMVAVPERDRRGTRVLLAALATMVLVAAGATVLLAGQHRGATDGSLERTAARLLTPQRLAYWSEALEMAQRHPATGVGPGRFRQLAPSARDDPDAVAVHNEYLQAAAELGVPGALIMLALFGWGFVRLAHGAPRPSTAPVAAGLAAVGLHASVDYALHAPAVVIALAMLLGTGAGPLAGAARRPAATSSAA